jgi:hypothetical protein
MSGGEIAAIIAAVGGLLTAIFSGYRALRGDKVNEAATQAANVLSGLQGLVVTLQAEIERLNEARKRDHEECLRHTREMEERIDELGTQVYILQNRPTTTKQRKTDR